MTAEETVPVVDLAGTGSEAGRHATADAIRAVCETIGFFAVVGHGVEQPVIDEVRARHWRSSTCPTRSRCRRRNLMTA